MRETITVLIPSRDGGTLLETTLRSLRAQTIPVTICVSDDHSIDETPEILKAYKVRYWRLPQRLPKDYDRVPFLLNKAYEISPESDYYMISGDDQDYPPDYVERIIEYMKRDKVDLASGHNHNHRFEDLRAPTGSGRIFTRKMAEVLFPLVHASIWDTWMLYKIPEYGGKVGIYPVAKKHLRWRKIRISFGQSSYQIGRPFIYVIFKFAKKTVVERDPLLGLSILLGYLEYLFRGTPQLDIAQSVNLKTRQRIARAVSRRIGGVIGV